MQISIHSIVVFIIVSVSIFLLGCPTPTPPPYSGTWRGTNIPVDLGSGPADYDIEVILSDTSWQIGLFAPGSGFTGFQDYSCKGTHGVLIDSNGGIPAWNNLNMTHVWLGNWAPWPSTVYGAINLSVGGNELYFWYDNNSDHGSVNSEGLLYLQ